MLLLLILIMQVVSPIAKCYHFIFSYAGFTFDDPPESLIAGIPATITWHRTSYDPDDIYFERRNVVSQSSGNGDSIPSPSDTTQLQGTLTVTFPSAGKYLIEVVESQKNDVIGSSHSLTVASQASQNSENSISSSVSSSPSLASSASNPLTTSTGATSQLTSASPRTTNSSAIGPKQSAYESIATFHCAIPDMSLRYYVSSVSSPINSVTIEQKPSADDPIISGSSRPGPLPADPGSASEQAGPDGEEVPPAALGVIETELRQLKTQVHQILSEREAEWVQDDPFDRPPSYAETTF
ncbi:hypothetical protein EV421DRAFT_2023734 [Armillaria borealis]|uniref:GOLD domain-containing protein n=1 Tax=Armillaria borealis TaxID=47425 RepID=A0AA39IZX6_9AGAR|nr:hypothetical protein EV421DRAFT_2023734 [Armillaria borealis]